MLEQVNTQNISAKLKSNSITFQNKKDSSSISLVSPLDPFQSFLSYVGTQSPAMNSDYDLSKAYEFVQLDVSAIQYNPGDEDYEQFRKIWNAHAPVKKVGNRIYSWFHSLKSKERSWLMIDGSHLIEAFDVHACNFCILGKLLENTDVDKKELREYQRIMKFEYIYEEIAKYAGIQFTKLVKDCIKKSCQHWLNIRKQHLKSGKNRDKYFDYVDSYFKNKFPSIYAAIVNWHEEEYTNAAGKTKKSKMLWNDYQAVQFEIITGKICLYLYKTYGVIPVTVHDAVYLSKADAEKITENIDEIFWKMIDYQFLDYGTENTEAKVYQLPETITGEIDVSEIDICKLLKSLDYPEKS